MIWLWIMTLWQTLREFVILWRNRSSKLKNCLQRMVGQMFLCRRISYGHESFPWCARCWTMSHNPTYIVRSHEARVMSYMICFSFNHHILGPTMHHPLTKVHAKATLMLTDGVTEDTITDWIVKGTDPYNVVSTGKSVFRCAFQFLSRLRLAKVLLGDEPIKEEETFEGLTTTLGIIWSLIMYQYHVKWCF